MSEIKKDDSEWSTDIMIKMYYNPSSYSSRRAKEWLIKHSLNFEEVNWLQRGMSEEEFTAILSLTENGTEDIISKRSAAYASFSKQLPFLSVREVYFLLNTHRNLLRLPIIIKDARLQVGYNSDEIRVFLPRNVRNTQLKQAYKNLRKISEG